MLIALNASESPLLMIVSLLGGLALFLHGLDQMTESLKAVAGGRLKTLLGRVTSTPFAGLLAGAAVTAALQSSSITTVLVVGFVSAGLMNLRQAIGVIIGANIGTTITAQMVAFRITNSALVLLVIGSALHFFARKEAVRRCGSTLFGFGLLFFGMNMMSDATAPLRSYPQVVVSAHSMDHVLTGVLIAAAFTAIIQSSSATTVIVMIMADQGVISLEQAIPLILGANIGTCVTALLAVIGKSREAVRAALVHVVFNFLGVLLWLPFTEKLAWLVTQLSNDTARQIAHAHTVFNCFNAAVFIWWTGPLARLVCWLVPEPATETAEMIAPKYLDEFLLSSPALALDRTRMELGCLGNAALNMVRDALQTALRGDETALDRLAELDDRVDILHSAIVAYLGRLSQQPLSENEAEQLHDFLLIANYFENIGDLIESQVVPAGRQRLHANLHVSAETERVLQALHERTCKAVELAVQSVVKNDPELARVVTDAKAEINELVEAAEKHLSRRLTAAAPQRIVAFRLESEIMEYLKRVYYYAKRIARIVMHLPYSIPPDGISVDSPVTDSEGTTRTAAGEEVSDDVQSSPE